jgi:hypothetical protein
MWYTYDLFGSLVVVVLINANLFNPGLSTSCPIPEHNRDGPNRFLLPSCRT